MSLLKLFIQIFIISSFLYPKIIISGHIINFNTKEGISDVNIYIKKSLFSTTSLEDGTFNLEYNGNSDEIEINDGKKSKTVAKLRGKLSKEKAAAEEGKQELQRKIDTLNAKRTEESEKLQSLQEQVEKLLLEKKMDHEKVNAFESVKSEIAKLVEEKGEAVSK